MIATTQYVSLAKKYRPAKLTALLAQEALIKILSYSIQHNRLAQGYLLTGIRGVGKTSSARIIAKTINCTSQILENNIIIPCELCKNCQNIANNSHPDIIEIDAASRTSVDDIREIIAGSEYKPLLARYKVFIIDEVHMLSKSAFSALLKILEEPPVHVVFVLATTEVQKIPSTIISRCQRYDLRRFTFDEIVEFLTKIVEAEKLPISEDGIKILAVRAGGSARDAITMLDQAANLGDVGVVNADMINKMLGLVATGTIVELFEKILSQDAEGALQLVGQAYNMSADLEKIIEEICELIAYCCKKKLVASNINPLYLPFDKNISAIIAQCNLAQLTILWQIFSNGLQEIKLSYNLLITTEMLIIKAIYSQNLPSVEELISDNTILPRQ